MKFAIISDIHGNLPALEAVMEDSQKQEINNYIIVGDYCLSNPYPNECITAIRNIENKYIIRGNEERYLENLIGKDQKNWTDGQMQISYWCFRNISSDNLNYLMDLPHTIDFECNGLKIHMAHSSDTFLGECEFKYWGPGAVAKKYANITVTPEMIQRDTCELFECNEVFQKKISDLAEGIYIFGHSHIQWSYKAKDKSVYLINPGSCGLPLDGMNNSAPYSILNISDEGKVDIEERRVFFDTEKYISSLMLTKQYVEANVWSKVIMKELLTAKEHLTFFLEFVENYANEIHDERRPYSVETWEKAYEIWSNT